MYTQTVGVSPGPNYKCNYSTNFLKFQTLNKNDSCSLELPCIVFVEKQFSCPMCPLVCSNSFILQEHVELHLQEQRSAEGTSVRNILFRSARF